VLTFYLQRIGRTPQRGRKNYGHKKVKFLNTVLEPGKVTQESFTRWFKDILQREEFVIHEENSFLDPSDGRLTALVVQATDMVFDGPDNSTWSRDFVRNVSPLVVRVSNWTIDLLADTNGWTKGDWAGLVGKWGLSCFGLLILVRNLCVY
jgi:hypothetical protein